MRFTTKAEYGLVALMHLARKSGQGPQSAKDIAAVEGLSTEYVEKLLNRMKHFGLVESHRGASGGFCLAEPADQITLRQVIEALDGTTFQTFCTDEVRENIVCNHLSACGLGRVWGGLKNVIDDYLEGITVGSLLEQHLVMSGKGSETRLPLSEGGVS